MRLPVRLEGAGKLESPHKGLALSKFVDPKDKAKDQKKDASRKPALDALVRINSAYPAYRMAFERWQGLTERGFGPGAVSFRGRVRDRMALGLGIESIHEIGCRLHHTYGAPVIPGSSLKGMLRAALLGRAEYREDALYLFGNGDSGGAARIFDAWWMPPAAPGGSASGLAVDVIAVHHQDYYSGKAAPADTEQPIPVHFLTVTGSFWFAMQAPDAGWAAFLKAAAQDVLSRDGIGAKRSAGYGRFVF